jgi:hypothetical protein
MNLLSKRTRVTALAATVVLLLLNSCSKKISFLTSATVPAARGYAKVKKDKNNNYMIQLQISNLAEVKRLQPSRETYVVWMETADQAAKNIGQIKSGSGMLSRKLKASFETVSAIKPTRIFITAEDDAGVQFPGDIIVLSTGGF